MDDVDGYVPAAAAVDLTSAVDVSRTPGLDVDRNSGECRRVDHGLYHQPIATLIFRR